MALTLRTKKGSPLTLAELDANVVHFDRHPNFIKTLLVVVLVLVIGQGLFE